ncbi:hypothetical protein FGIG_09681 [Fasciola gigantica]|uniref:Protein furry n=1 Tax=Fasciola gigantica TaxID=46835 RepID=A0A504YQN6_FASGI|nr:hypothetical protein FGIG_09681 [Fasciola gigantica]
MPFFSLYTLLFSQYPHISPLNLISESNCLTGQGCLISQLSDYLDGMRIYFESVADQAINPTCPAFFGSGMGTNVSGSSNMTVVSPQSGSTGPGTNSVLGPGNVTIGGGGGASSGIVAATGMAAASGVGMGSSASAIAASTAAVVVTAATNPVLTEAHLLVEMRLHLCVFLFEMIRQLPKDKRTQLLPTAMRHQMFLLISRWSGYHDHVMGLCPESDTSHLRVTVGQTSSVGVGSSQSSETYGPTGHNLDPGSDSSVQVGASPTSSSAISSSTNVITESTSSAVASNTGSASVCGMVSATDQAPTSMHSVPIQDSWELRLWTDLMWLANQAMAALACCGPIYDPHALFADHVTDQSTSSSSGCEFSSSGTNPNPGYILRWVSGLLISRDAVLSSSPWLWHCPVVDAGLCHVNLSHIGTAGYGFFNGASILTGGTGRERRLDSLLRQLGEETLTLLLDLNQASHLLLNWTIDQCYTSANVALANACFFVVCRVLGNISDFPCDFIPLLTLAMVYLDHPQKSLSDRAAHLLRVIYYRFVIKPGLLVHDHVHLNEDASNPCTWDDDPSISPQSERDTFSALCAETKISLQLWQSILRWSPTEVVRQFAAQHPDFTLPIISEITRRMGTDRNVLSVPLLRLLLPWIINVELIDLIGDPEDGTNGNNKTVRYPGLFGFGTRDDSDGEPNTCHQRRSIRQRQIIHCTDRSGGRTLGHRRLSDDDIDRDAGLADHEGDDDEEEDEERCLIADSHPASDLDHSEEETEDDDTAFLPNYFAPKTTGYHSMERHPSCGATRHRCTCPRVEDAPVDSDGLDSDANNEVDLSTGPLGSSCRRPKAGTVPLIGPHGEADLKHGVRPRWMTDSVRKPHEDSLRATCDADFWSTVPPTLRTNGWGSKQVCE